ncbi:amidohydrolase [Acidovorax carolinensis]|uniref:Amidohydrolase n=1 Tax=Acidovorax carolinensis TaxID=553814 RepID=A0A240UD67_9BURK|nr:M20 family metallopeptidase [Acidovorax carolinensis]ART55226.1 amidohydrolase [Acidovorax carolinensis]ART58989.1 amidohydrolase [Acidovorax carolinensis]
MHPIDELRPFFEQQAPRTIALSDQIWSLAELRYAEEASVKLHTDGLAEAGFRIQQPVADIPTAFMAEYGEGGPVIGLLGEYDALSGLNQQSGALQCMPSSDSPGMNGHGCGHHLLGTAAHLAALAVQQHLRTHKLPGRIRFYGCPAEEGGSGKTFMARAGAFTDLDAALTWHPSSHTGIFDQSTLANIQASFVFKGRAAHAANAPHLGRSALDAVELMNVGCNYLREHMPPSARVHYAVTDSGGMSPNVVQARAEVLYLIRAARNIDAAELYERVQNVARGAALMTGCEVDIRFDKACSNLLQNTTLNQVMYTQMQHLGRLPVGEKEREQARQHHATLGASDIEEAGRSLSSALRGQVTELFDGIKDYDPAREELLYGSTDVADVSWVTPTAQAWVACYAFGTPFHSWQMVSQGKTSLAHVGMLQAAKILAATAIELLSKPDMLAAARQELQARREGKPYTCPIPAEIPLPFRRS